MMPGQRLAPPFLKKLGMAVEWIDTNGQPYLMRLHLTLQKWWPFDWRVCLHVFSRPDADRVFHDHPHWFKTIVLWGGYDEISHDRRGPWVKQGEPEVNDGLSGPQIWGEAPTGKIVKDRLGWLSLRSRDAEHAHRITRLHSRHVVTLVIRGSKSRNWGFWCPPADYVIEDEYAGDIMISRVNNQTNEWKWVWWRDYLDIRDPVPGEEY